MFIEKVGMLEQIDKQQLRNEHKKISEKLMRVDIRTDRWRQNKVSVVLCSLLVLFSYIHNDS